MSIFRQFSSSCLRCRDVWVINYMWNIYLKGKRPCCTFIVETKFLFLYRGMNPMHINEKKRVNDALGRYAHFLSVYCTAEAIEWWKVKFDGNWRSGNAFPQVNIRNFRIRKWKKLIFHQQKKNNPFQRTVYKYTYTHVCMRNSFQIWMEIKSFTYFIHTNTCTSPTLHAKSYWKSRNSIQSTKCNSWVWVRVRNKKYTTHIYRSIIKYFVPTHIGDCLCLG